jgi:hypothetical protein
VVVVAVAGVSCERGGGMVGVLFQLRRVAVWLGLVGRLVP